MRDNLGDRMKDQYENRTRYFLPRRTYTIIRLDGKAFHTFTRGMKRPYDQDFMELMDKTALALCAEVAGAKFAYVQSDEISILLTDFDKQDTQAWFDNNIQKITSVSASMAAAYFNHSSILGNPTRRLAFFDARVFTINDPVEVQNYFIWRQKDAERNSLQMVAQNLYSQKELRGKKSAELHELIYEKNDNWNNYPTGFKRGRVCRRANGLLNQPNAGPWIVDTNIPVFTQEREFLRIPELPRLEA